MSKNYDENRRYTYADYLEWEGPERYQLIDGEVFQMASPSVAHQGILMELSSQFYNWLKGKPCQVFAAPLDVRLFPKKDKSDKTVVQPDLLVVEIVSSSETYNEYFLKFYYYLKAGVREYWIIDPEMKRMQVNIYENSHYLCTIHKDDAHIPVTVLPGLNIALEDLWARIPGA